MAASKRTKRPRKKHKKDPFAFARGKVVKRIEISTHDDDCAIGIMFKDRTYLGFDLTRSFASRPITPTGKLTTTNLSNAGHLSAPNNSFSNIKSEPAERRVFSIWPVSSLRWLLPQNARKGAADQLGRWLSVSH